MIDIDIRNALNQPGKTFQYRYEGTPDIPGLTFAKPLWLQADYCVVDDKVSVKGQLIAVLVLPCTRCLKEVAFETACDFDEWFQKDAADGEESYPYTGETVSLDKMVYDAVELAIPQQVLCREDCRGLCQSCGANLNEEQCSCRETTADDENNPFVKLKEFF